MQQHRAGCAAAAVEVPAEVQQALLKLGASVLQRQAEVTWTPSLGWMATLRGAGRWRPEAGTPLEYEAPDPWNNNPRSWAWVEPRQARALATLRLIEGVRSGALVQSLWNAAARLPDDAWWWVVNAGAERNPRESTPWASVGVLGVARVSSSARTALAETILTIASPDPFSRAGAPGPAAK